MSKNVLEVKDLTMHYRTLAGNARAAEDVSFTLSVGESLGLVGESGCGKTTVIRSVLRLLPPNGEVLGGEVWLNGRDLLKVNQPELRAARWSEISLISQSAMNSLNPVYRVGDQIIEAILAHEETSRKKAWKHAEHLFDMVGLEPTRLGDYPHQFSGGMRQRAVIAMALALEPSVIIADEPTTALDVIVQAQILAKINEMQERTGVGLILVTHDMSVIAQTCETVAVMYAGRIVEYGDAAAIFGKAFHPYTMGLQNAFPSVKGERRELISMPGYPPELINLPPGCRFAERCPFAEEKCRQEEPPLFELPDGHTSACWFNDRAEEFRELANKEQTWKETAAARAGIVR